ncbi:MAG: hypothetical protein H7Z71_05255 [Moraxellaceae bacterium]|nr:hypothetical protein [Pseudobdellovibrionaceae bacterium]
MTYLEKAFLPLFVFIATISGLAFGSMIPILFLVIPVLTMPFLMYSYTQMYKYRYRLLTEDEPVIDLAHFSTQIIGAEDNRNFIKYSFDHQYNVIDDDQLAPQRQITDLTNRELPELTDAMPSNGSATQSFTAVGARQWLYRFHFKSVSAEFNAIGVGTEPKEAFAVAKQVLQRQIREWHIVRQTDENYVGEANTELLQNLPDLSQLHVGRDLNDHIGAATAENNLETIVEADRSLMQQGKVKSPTVLIVEDDPDVAMATESIFKQLGCKTILSDGHDGASHKMSFQDVDFIVLDWMLGDNLSADQLVKKSTRIIDAYKDLRSKFHNQHAKVITYSALDRSKVQLPQSDYFDHLDHWQKPVNYTELTKRASDLLVANGY